MRAVVLVLLLVTGVAHAQVLRPGDPAVELDVAVDASGKPFKLSAYRGRWVVLSIGAAWCDPCKAELPVLDQLAMQWNAVFISLAIDNAIPDGKAFHARLKLTRLVRAYMPEDRSAVVGRYGAHKMPANFVIDPTGVVRVYSDGFNPRTLAASTKKLRDALASVLPAPAPKPPKPAVVPPRPAITPPTPITPPAKALVSAVPPILWPDAPRVAWWSTSWPPLTL